MKAMKRAFYGSMVVSFTAIVGIGMMNSFDMGNKNNFLKNDYSIKFAKRIDDITGEYIVGRTAASIPKGLIFNKTQKKSLALQPAPITTKEVEKKEVKNEVSKTAVEKFEDSDPVIKEIAAAQLTGGMYNRNPLLNVPENAGSISVSRGEITNLSVNLPNGGKFSPTISRDAMVGNVFQYEDTETREMKSGLLYKIKEGHYMATFTDDSKHGTVRLEFKNKKAISDENKSTWAMNEQNSENKVDRKSFDYANSEDNEPYDNKEDFVKDDNSSYVEDEYVQNETEDSDYNEGELEDEFEGDPVAKSVSTKKNTYAFSFTSL